MTVFLWIVLAVSLFEPVYTYVMYPFLLAGFRRKNYKKSEYMPKVSVIILGHHPEAKIKNLYEQEYFLENISVQTEKTANGTDLSKAEKINNLISDAQGEIILFTDDKTRLDKEALKKMAANFSDSRVGSVCGQIRKENGQESAYWKYENWVREQEGKIGRVSGANSFLFAIRKEAVSKIPQNTINRNFFLSTAVIKSGWDAVFERNAIAYEQSDNTSAEIFNKHVEEGAGYYQALWIFRKMLLPSRGSFTYISHRVMKWIIPFNMIAAFFSSALLGSRYKWVHILFLSQLAGYIILGIYAKARSCKKEIKGSIGKLLSLMQYFAALNLSYLIGLGELLFKRKKFDEYN